VVPFYYALRADKFFIHPRAKPVELCPAGY